MNCKQRVLMLLLFFGFVGQATALTCYSGPANTTVKTECKQTNETCVTVKRYVQDVLFKTEKGCLKNCRNKCIDEPSGNIRRCYTCCAGNLCNDETKPTPSQRPSVTSSSINTATKKPDGTNAGMMKTSGMYLFFLIFLAQIFFMEFL